MYKDFISRGRSVSDIKIHLVLTTKYRRKVFTAQMINRLHEIFESLLDKWDCKIVEFNGEEDHVHLLFQYHPEIQLSKLVNSLKSVSSRKLRQEFLPELEKTYYKKKVVWNSSYFLASCGGVTISTLKKYIENQDSPIVSLLLAIHPTLIAIVIQAWSFSQSS
ncbi:IS200/IS605 family transposase [Pleurocapsa sp. PCC 7319]|uniref:IS200/IS605 family transposase n=1 Tax=Pleurocapsa sp. PCC 7319 TaxID=118161 RepID=UPI0003498383|nr:IS200/IS605 family transposase [Pleurocapsa sp. PCC 7319]